ncbi:MAG: DNA polymerase IV [Actinomycetota bacterium]
MTAPRAVAHLDLDAFFAAVEMHLDPGLRGRPVAVGGDPQGRGVVATANYAARRFGVRSAMPCREAARRCPGLVFVPPRIDVYREWSARVWDVVRGLADPVEVVGLDEGYLELDPDRPAAHAAEIQRAVADGVRLSCSVGVGGGKTVAKIASDRDKPGGLVVVPPGGDAAFLAPLPLRALPGLGPRSEERLRAAGLATIGELAALPDADLDALLPGVHGRDLRRRASGLDPRPVRPDPPERISISVERTFPVDVGDPAEIDRRLAEMAARLEGLLSSRGRVARTVTVKARFPDFRTTTRHLTVPDPVAGADAILDAARTLLARIRGERDAPLRLLGVGVRGLTDRRQLRLF